MRQCFGSTRTLRRCQRRGDWRIFCDDHRHQWIVLLVFVLFTAGPGVGFYLGLFKASPDQSPPLTPEIRDRLGRIERRQEEEIAILRKANPDTASKEAIEKDFGKQYALFYATDASGVPVETPLSIKVDWTNARIISGQSGVLGLIGAVETPQGGKPS